MQFDANELLPPLKIDLTEGPRAVAAERLHAALDAGTANVWLRGPRHSGKTELVAGVCDALRGKGHVVHVLDIGHTLGSGPYADARAWSDKLAAGLRVIATPPGDKREVPRPPLGGDATEILEEAIADLRPTSGRVVLVLDSIDHAMNLPEGDILRRWIHAVAAERQVMVCVISALRPEDLPLLLEPAKVSTPDPWDAALWEVLSVDDLTRAEVHAGFRGSLPEPDHPLVAPILSAVYEWSGGHSRMVQRLCLRLAKDWSALAQPATDGLDLMETAERIVEDRARDLFFRPARAEEPKEIAYVRLALAEVGTTDKRTRVWKADPDLAASARDLRAGAGVGADRASLIAVLLLERAGIATWRGATPVLRRSRVLATVFSPEHIHAECGGYGESALPETFDGAGYAAAEEWLRSHGPVHARVIATLQRTRASEEEARQTERAGEKSRSREWETRVRTFGAFVVPAFLVCLVGWIYSSERINALGVARQSELAEQAVQLTAVGEQARKDGDEREKRLAEQAARLDLALKQAQELATQAKANVTTAQNEKARAEHAVTSADAIDKKSAARAVKEAGEKLDKAARDADEANAKSVAAEKARAEANLALANVTQANKALTQDLEELKSKAAVSQAQMASIAKALTLESNKRAACARDLDAARAETARQEKARSDCAAETKKAEDERTAAQMSLRACVPVTPPGG
jgi:hypothetical protein